MTRWTTVTSHMAQMCITGVMLKDFLEGLSVPKGAADLCQMLRRKVPASEALQHAWLQN